MLRHGAAIVSDARYTGPVEAGLLRKQNVLTEMDPSTSLPGKWQCPK